MAHFHAAGRMRRQEFPMNLGLMHILFDTCALGAVTQSARDVYVGWA